MRPEPSRATRPRRGTSVRGSSRRPLRLLSAVLAVPFLLSSCGLLPGDGEETKKAPAYSSPAGPPVPKCAQGTRSLGLHEGFSEGHRHRVLLCAVNGLPSGSPESTPGAQHYLPGARGEAIVNQRISDGAAALRREAKRQGIELQVTSSFRTQAHQRNLCNQDPGCTNGDPRLVNPPGYSNHQMGLALDFEGTGVTGTKSCTNGRANDPNSPVWDFLNEHADRRGLRQYAAESWHWESAQLPTACPPLSHG